MQFAVMIQISMETNIQNKVEARYVIFCCAQHWSFFWSQNYYLRILFLHYLFKSTYFICLRLLVVVCHYYNLFPHPVKAQQLLDLGLAIAYYEGYRRPSSQSNTKIPSSAPISDIPLITGCKIKMLWIILWVLVKCKSGPI